MYSLTEKSDILTDQVKTVIRDCLEAVRGDDPDVQIILYGSQACGRAQADSDLDLLVLLKKQVSSAKKIRIHDLLYEIGLSQDISISAMINSIENWNKPIFKATPLYKTIQSEGIKIT